MQYVINALSFVTTSSICVHNKSMVERAPAKFEFDLLQFISQYDGLTVRQVFEEFGKPHGYIRGTIVKSMDRLLKKGMLERTEVEGTYVYRSKFESDKMERRLVESFIEHRLGGSLQPIVNFLSAKENFTAEEIAQIRSLVEKLDA